MARSMTSSMSTAIQSGILRPAIFVELHLFSGVSYLWSGYGTISWNGHSWLGLGNFGTISVIEEGVTVNARGISLTLNGINSSMLADALQEIQLGAPALVYFGLFNSSSPPALLPDPLTSWAGRVDQPVINVNGETATITLNCENRLIDMSVAVDRRYTNDDQNIDNPGDLGFQFVNSIQEMTVYFGRTPNGQNV